ncbi:MAG: ABC transporter substrate-binding protein [Parvibaculaceae bacterium]|nr:ABC transporter substrate-binding protein [Parvibaculaceae bacterium]
MTAFHFPKVHLGFIPLVDSAPFIIAEQKGFFANNGLDVELHKEVSWANIRDRTIHGHFHAAQMLGPMPIAASLGLGHLKVDLIAPMALGLGGNAVTVSSDLLATMRAVEPGLKPGDPINAGRALATCIADRKQQGGDHLVFAVVYPFSAHNYELRYWLAASGIRPDHDVRFIAVPPSQMVAALKDGHIDGFCVGEPWSSLAAQENVGQAIISKSTIWPGCLEKVLGMCADWAEAHPEIVDALIVSLDAACAWCEVPKNCNELASILSSPKFVGTSTQAILRSLTGKVVEEGVVCETAFMSFHGDAANMPWRGQGLWLYSQMVRWGHVAHSSQGLKVAKAVYRPDIYARALGDISPTLAKVRALEKTNFFSGKLYDGCSFDPTEVEKYLRSLEVSAYSARG